MEPLTIEQIKRMQAKRKQMHKNKKRLPRKKKKILKRYIHIFSENLLKEYGNTLAKAYADLILTGECKLKINKEEQKQ